MSRPARTCRSRSMAPALGSRSPVPRPVRARSRCPRSSAMSRLKVPFFAVALAAILLVVLVELGEPLIVGGGAPPGRGIPYLALVDGVALFTIALMGIGLLAPKRLH